MPHAALSQEVEKTPIYKAVDFVCRQHGHRDVLAMIQLLGLAEKYGLLYVSELVNLIDPKQQHVPADDHYRDEKRSAARMTEWEEMGEFCSACPPAGVTILHDFSRSVQSEVAGTLEVPIEELRQTFAYYRKKLKMAS